jgi:hypothetical protein
MPADSPVVGAFFYGRDAGDEKSRVGGGPRPGGTHDAIESLKAEPIGAIPRTDIRAEYDNCLG